MAAMTSTILNKFLLLAEIILLSFPLVMAWGWVRWVKRKTPMTLFSAFSFFGFVLATASELLAISTATYASVTSSSFYDPTLLKIYAVGMLLSLVGLILSIVGAFKANSLRYLAPGCALGTFFFWFMAAATE